MQQNDSVQPTGSQSGNSEKNQARTGSEVREGQEDSSILHDKNDPQKELTGTPDVKIDPSTNQEEYIDDQRPT